MTIKSGPKPDTKPQQSSGLGAGFEPELPIVEEGSVQFHFGQPSPRVNSVSTRTSSGIQSVQTFNNVPEIKDQGLRLSMNLSPSLSQSQPDGDDVISYELIEKKKGLIASKKNKIMEAYGASLQGVEDNYKRDIQNILRVIQVKQDELYARNLDRSGDEQLSPKSIDCGERERMLSIKNKCVDLKQSMLKAYTEALSSLETELNKWRKLQIQLDEREALRYSEELNNAPPRRGGGVSEKEEENKHN